jgi:hypothetical protein
MSMKSDKSDTRSHHASVPIKDDIAIVPPKKVSRFLSCASPRRAFSERSNPALSNLCRSSRPSTTTPPPTPATSASPKATSSTWLAARKIRRGTRLAIRCRARAVLCPPPTLRRLGSRPATAPAPTSRTLTTSPPATTTRDMPPAPCPRAPPRSPATAPGCPRPWARARPAAAQWSTALSCTTSKPRDPTSSTLKRVKPSSSSPSPTRSGSSPSPSRGWAVPV